MEAFGADGVFSGKAGRCVLQFFICRKDRTDCGMGANDGALVALNAVFSLPFRYQNSYAPFFIGCCALREGTIFQAGKGADREGIPFLTVNGLL